MNHNSFVEDLLTSLSPQTLIAGFARGRISYEMAMTLPLFTVYSSSSQPPEENFFRSSSSSPHLVQTYSALPLSSTSIVLQNSNALMSPDTVQTTNPASSGWCVTNKEKRREVYLLQESVCVLMCAFYTMNWLSVLFSPSGVGV